MASSLLSSQSPIDTQHAAGKLTAHERLDILLDDGSFEDMAQKSSAQKDSSVLTGSGTIHGRRVFVFAKDNTVLKGTLCAAHAEKIIALQTRAIEARAPLIGLYDSSGMRIEDGISTLARYACMARLHVQASGLIPQIAVIMGSCTGADAFLAALTDFIFMVSETSSLFVTGPEITNRLTGLNLTSQSLGGADLHNATSGLADAAFADDIAALTQVRRFVDFLPSSCHDTTHNWLSFDTADRTEASLDTLVPEETETPYDIKDLILKIVDEGDIFEIQAAFAPNIVTAFARMQGRTIGIVANQPLILGGVLDADAARKAARFVRFCDCFNLPVVTFADTPGFLPGQDQEEKALAAQGAKLLVAYAQANVPKVTVILGPAYGAAYVMMGSKQLGAGKVLAWPSAKISLTNENDSSLSTAETQGMIDAVIQPNETRKHLIEALTAGRISVEPN